MRILEMTASFGCLNGRALRFSEGINQIVLPNESGKSTWAAFLLAMFYGIDSSERAAKGRLPAKIRYKPWNGAPMEGTVTLLRQGQKIVLQRTSEKGKPMGTFRAFDPDTGMDIPGLTGENCGQRLLGVEKEVFRRTAFLSGGELAVAQEQNLARRLANLAASGSMEESFPAAEETLKSWKHRYRYHNRGLIPETEERLCRHTQKQAEAETLRTHRKMILQRINALEQQAEKIPVRKEKEERLGLALLPIYVVGGAVCALMKQWKPAVFMAVAAVCFLTAFFVNRRHNKRVKAAGLAARQREEEIQALRMEAAVAQARLEDLQPAVERTALEEELEELLFREKALELALSALEQAEDELAKGYGPHLTACAGERIAVLSEGRYDAVLFDRELNLSLRERDTGLARPLAALSRGTQDQAWLALRLAMTQLLLPEHVPIVLDDALLTFDEDRTAAALNALEAEERQVLLFSCKPL